MWHVWGSKEIHTEIWLGNMKVEDRLDDTGVDGRTILKVYLTEKRQENVYKIDGTQDREKRRALVKTAVNIQIP
jgi:hypothetical protein